jgi:hypothetical protein
VKYEDALCFLSSRNEICQLYSDELKVTDVINVQDTNYSLVVTVIVMAWPQCVLIPRYVQGTVLNASVMNFIGTRGIETCLKGIRSV